MKQRIHREYFRVVLMNNRKSCPTCKNKLNGESIWSWGEYVCGKWRTVDYFCKSCFERNVKTRLVTHKDDCGCNFELVPYHTNLPTWLSLD